jgi:hypothetical protein
VLPVEPEYEVQVLQIEDLTMILLVTNTGTGSMAHSDSIRVIGTRVLADGRLKVSRT